MTVEELKRQMRTDITAFRQHVDMIRAQRAAVEPDRSARVSAGQRVFTNAESNVAQSSSGN